jgi:photosystem II stability/assembly factor-like uncharacterized protein
LSMKSGITSILFLLFLSFLISCKKEEKNISVEGRIVLDETITIRDISFVNDTLAFACGGMPGERGSIWRSTDGGLNWTLIIDMPGHCIYDVEFIDPNNGFSGGDKLLLLRTYDGGNTWKDVFENESFDSWQEFIRPIRKIKYLNSYTIIAIGGDTYYKGLMCCSYNWGVNWTFNNFNNQLNDIEMPDSRHAWLCGYGIMFRSEDSCITLQTIDVREDHFTAIDFYDHLTGLSCGYNGGIYRTVDGGISWKEQLKSNGTFGKRIHLNDICFAGPSTAFAAGNSGLLLVSADGGMNWNEVKTDIDADLHTLYAKSSDEVFAGGSDGTLYHLHF